GGRDGSLAVGVVTAGGAGVGAVFEQPAASPAPATQTARATVRIGSNGSCLKTPGGASAAGAGPANLTTPL
ncbi:MAG: hypothetical protein ACREJ3_11335, partial [Polyangiaceae bacterium]